MAWGEYLSLSISPALILVIDKRQEKARLDAASGNASTPGHASNSANVSVAGGDDSSAPTRHGTEEMDADEEGGDKDKSNDNDMEHAEKDKSEKEKGESHPPAKKYRMTDSMKNIVWELVLLSNECCRLENEKKCVLSIFFSALCSSVSTQHVGGLRAAGERTGLAQGAVPEDCRGVPRGVDELGPDIARW